MALVDFVIRRLTRNVAAQPVVTFERAPLFDRYEFLRDDEWPDTWYDRLKASEPDAKRPNRLPWWMPFNAFLHHWKLGPDTPESFHDHPRWSITICLKGQIIERTPWGERLLRSGSMVFRSRKYIHAFEIPPGFGEVWTLFIVGRRKHRQNSFLVTPR